MPFKDLEKRRKYAKKRYKKKIKDKDFKEAERNRLKKFQKQWNQKTQGRLNHSKQWTEQEIAILWDTTRTTKEIAKKLQRSWYAIGAARARFQSKQPTDYIHNGNPKT